MKYNFEKILDRIDYWRERDEELQKATDQFCRVIAPDCYAPILSVEIVKGYIEGVAQEDNLLMGWLEHYAWDIGAGKEFPCSQKVNGRVIECENAGDKKLFAKFLNQIFNETL